MEEARQTVVEVAEIEPVPERLPASGHQPEIVPTTRTELRDHDEDEQQHQVVGGKDAQRPAGVEGAVVVLGRSAFEQNACDQETREHEEEVDTREAQGG